MPSEPQADGAEQPGFRGDFPQTRWSVVRDAQRDDPEALATFCGAYWFPLYGYARRLCWNVAEAEDLTQAFFERLLQRDVLVHAQQERGRMRSFFLQAFKNFSAEEWRRQNAQKRGGNKPFLALDALSAEERLAREPHHGVTPEIEYDRAWARELLRQALEKLESDYDASGNKAIFEALRDRLAEGSSDRSYKEIADKMGVSEGSARFAAFKLRQRYRAVLRECVADTVSTADEIDAELSYLQILFAGNDGAT